MRKKIRRLGVLTFFKQALAGFLMNPPQQRVLHHCTAINIKGASYRLKERKEFIRRKQLTFVAPRQVGAESKKLYQ